MWHEITPHFGPHEFLAPYEMDVHFLRLLHSTRLAAGVPFRITSDARDPDGSVGASLSAHKKRPCRAVDLHVKSNYERMCVLGAAVANGFVRIGIYPAREDGAGIIHLDAETHPDNPSPRCWTRY